MTEEHVSGAFGETLTLGGFSVMLRPKASPSTSQCSDVMPNAMVFELTVTSTIPFDAPHFPGGWCLDPNLPIANGVVYDFFLPVTPGAPVSIGIVPTGYGMHTLYFDFH